MKKSWAIFLLLVCPLVFSACVNSNQENDDIKVMACLPDVSCPYTHKEWIRSPDAWQAVWPGDACLSEIASSQQFDQAFFEDYALILFTLPHSSGEKDFAHSQSALEDGTLTITLDMRAPTDLDTDVIKDLYCIRVPKDRADSVAKITVRTWNLTLQVSNIRLSWEVKS